MPGTARKLRRDAGQPQDAFQNKIFRDFGGLNTQAHRQAIGPNEFSWIENVIPIGHGNAQILPAPSEILATLPTPLCYYMKSYNINGVNYMFMSTTAGRAYQVLLDSPYTVTEITTNPAVAQFGTGGVFMAQWKNERIMIVDPASGLYDWDGTTLTPPTTVVSLTILSPGVYTAIPTITIAGGGGAGATATAIMGINGVQTVTAGGAGYTVGDILTLVGGTGTPGQVRVTVAPAGVVTDVAVFDPGSYTVLGAAPLATSGGTGAGATITPSYGVFSATMTDNGVGYTSEPTVTFGSGAAQAEANLIGSPAAPELVATFSGRVWVAFNRTIVWSVPNTYNDFTGQGSGSKIVTDETLLSNIRNLTSANQFLYYFGLTSVNAIGDVQLDANSNTVFSDTNLTAAIGTGYVLSPTPFYRSILYVNSTGVYALSGSTPVKISDPLDGFFPGVNLAANLGGATVSIANNLCAAYLFPYTDALGDERSLIALFFNKKWFLAYQGELIAIGSGTESLKQNLYGTDGNNLYRLFDDPNTSVAWRMESAFWDMDDVTQDKQVTSFGFEIDTLSVQGAVQFNIDAITKTAPYMDTEEYSVSVQSLVEWRNGLASIIDWQNNVLDAVDWSAAGYILNMQDGSNFGKYIGITMSSSTVTGTISSMMLRYLFREDW